jgi:hypothetical protein
MFQKGYRIIKDMENDFDSGLFSPRKQRKALRYSYDSLPQHEYAKQNSNTLSTDIPSIYITIFLVKASKTGWI